MAEIIVKRGRKKKVEVISPVSIEPEIVKKRGRKPKGGKIVNNTDIPLNIQPEPKNIILHLRCSLKDLDNKSDIGKDLLSYNPDIPPEVMSYDTNKSFSFISGEQSIISDDKIAYSDILCNTCNDDTIKPDIIEIEDDSISLKDIHQKLKRLRTQFYKNTLNDKKSDCFWCTYDFDNEPCYIPKYELNDTIAGYGCFCRPECAVGFLMNESINDSTKFERYQLLNQIYSKVYDFKKNIKPAPSPFFLLDKFYGSLSIQEYRKLLKTEHMLLVLDKPLTRILPELHDDNDEFILNIYGGIKTNQGTNSGQYKVKRQSEKSQGPTKKSILNNAFGIV
jgi:hypothetical protein